ncbi:MAG: hypothetical protein ACQEWU_06960 [Bacillota bacterium]|uniref:Spore coat protein W n=1 Tax=Virgibacillus salarius TaxID=447199 RepID=A0A941DUV2_9BACI|nr:MULTISPECIES: hypothetical protein [Bacillaceae]NAZ09874.1 hypothetical protein [Agaribacter marinus]MBR7797165.1 hypothetical protein [Virgibacillus salarius]MCC2251274.1 hypothetical protein [Virgibacillus sp. AGTR]MDY7043839.1 hypothetical protein [Virgibacillus sp. M23]QRZ19487.1 hypothetical protein JUJ52_07415 [Virgibacillus sp. AGTR]
MSKNSEKNSNNAPGQIVDFLLDATLKKHGASLKTKELDEKDKEMVRNMVNQLRKNVEEFTQENKDTNENKE